MAERSEARWLVHEGYLNLSKQSLVEIEDEQIEDWKPITFTINLSYNLLTNIKFLDGFCSLQTLILDYNHLRSLKPMPEIFSLKCLSLVQNQIADLEECLEECRTKTHNLQHLTLIQNPCCPFLRPDSTPEEFEQYRKNVIICLKSLQSLDGSNISRQEIADANSSILEYEQSQKKLEASTKGKMEMVERQKKKHPAPKPQGHGKNR